MLNPFTSDAFSLASIKSPKSDFLSPTRRARGMGKLAAVALVLLLVGVAIAVPAPAAAQSIHVDPDRGDFVDVEVGTQDTLSFTITGQPSAFIDRLVISGDSDGVFTILSAPELPIYLDDGPAEVVVEFAPGAVGSYTADLGISGTDPSGTVDVPLSGTAIYPAPPPPDPATMIHDLLAFFDASIADGSLCGVGDNPRAREVHAGVMRRHIVRAGDQIEAGRTDRACFRLWRAYLRSDGADEPSDFVAGPASAEVASRVLEIMDAYGCP